MREKMTGLCWILLVVHQLAQIVDNNGEEKMLSIGKTSDDNNSEEKMFINW